MKFTKHLIAAATTAALLAPMTASATNGYFSAGYGAASRGVAGASTALSLDSYAAAVNPAGMAHVGNRVDLGVTLFNPDRSASVGPGSARSELNGFIIPSGGYVRDINDKLTAGITMYANGGMNTSYDQDDTGGTNLYGFPDRLGIDYAQLIFAPTLAYKINKNHSVGASLLIGYQQFKAYGLQSFCGFRGNGADNSQCGTAPDSDISTEGLTNQGYDHAWGTGLRVGWQGKLSENVTMGAAYSTKVYMDEFDDYDRLFAEQGDIDIPANWSIGIAAKITPKTTMSFDIQHIEYSDVKSIANDGPFETGAPFDVVNRNALGEDNGLGFGWDDMTIYKLGFIYEHDANFTYRFGISHGDQPIGSEQALFNVLAPAVIETHATAGFTWRPSGKDDQELTFTYMHAFENEVENNTGYQFFGGATAEIEMFQHAFDFGYSWKF